VLLENSTKETITLLDIFSKIKPNMTTGTRELFYREQRVQVSDRRRWICKRLLPIKQGLALSIVCAGHQDADCVGQTRFLARIPPCDPNSRSEVYGLRIEPPESVSRFHSLHEPNLSRRSWQMLNRPTRPTMPTANPTGSIIVQLGRDLRAVALIF
jgi:hypothetical protein